TRVAVVEAARLVVVVEERDEERARLAVRADHAALHLLAVLEHLREVGRRREALRDGRQPEEEREVESRVDADEISRLARPAPDELRDLVLAIVDLPEREEVALADADRELAHRVPELLREVALDALERVDAEAVDVVA